MMVSFVMGSFMEMVFITVLTIKNMKDNIRMGLKMAVASLIWMKIVMFQVNGSMAKKVESFSCLWSLQMEINLKWNNFNSKRLKIWSKKSLKNQNEIR